MTARISISKDFNRKQPVKFTVSVSPGSEPVQFPNETPFRIARKVNAGFIGVFNSSSSDNPFTLKGGQKRLFEWNQKNDHGDLVDFGTYFVEVFQVGIAEPLREQFKIARGWVRKSLLPAVIAWNIAKGTWELVKDQEEVKELAGSALSFGLKALSGDPPDPNFETLVEVGDIMRGWRSHGYIDLDRLASDEDRQFAITVARAYDLTVAIWRTTEKISGAEKAGSPSYIEMQFKHLQMLCDNASQVITETAGLARKCVAELPGYPDASYSLDEIIHSLRLSLERDVSLAGVEVAPAVSEQKKMIAGILFSVREGEPMDRMNLGQISIGVYYGLLSYLDVLRFIIDTSPDDLRDTIAHGSALFRSD